MGSDRAWHVCPFHADKCPYGFKVVVEGASAADPPRVICRPSSVDAATSGVRKAVTQASREALRAVDEKMARVREAQRKAEEQRELKGTTGGVCDNISARMCACMNVCVRIKKFSVLQRVVCLMSVPEHMFLMLSS
jgi:hypothetical protein